MKTLISVCVRQLAATLIANKTAYRFEKDPAVIQLNKTINLLKKNDYESAEKSLKAYHLESLMKTRKDHWGHRIPSVRNAIQAYENARRMVETKNPYTLRAVLKSVEYLKDAEAAINRLQPRPLHETEEK